MEIHEIVSKLIGPIRGIGESSSDAKRLENIGEFIRLHDEMTLQLITIARDKDVFESSVKKIGIKSNDYLRNVSEIFKEIDESLNQPLK